MKFLDVEVARDMEVWPPVPEVVEIPKLKAMSDLIIGTFAISAMRLRGLCHRCETGNGGSYQKPPCTECMSVGITAEALNAMQPPWSRHQLKDSTDMNQDRILQSKLESREKDSQPIDLQLGESSFLRRAGREWKSCTFGIQGNRILKLRPQDSQDGCGGG